MTSFIQLSVFLVALAQAVAVPDHPPVIDAREYKLCDVSISDSEELVTAVLGLPVASESYDSSIFCDVSKELRWPGITAHFCDDELVNLSVSSGRCETPSGVKVGMLVSDVHSLLGYSEPEVYAKNKKGIRYWIKDTDCYLLLAIEDGRISEIELWFDYT